ncbi:expressed unknown protein [Seminavis robusta]|uniref:Uncharacterized protein n=1 Tax=Seminavis robusta TaxID=568900 RepID=A0A9N8EJG2_9STRA|nr:expressed unknown protein [Seminavis robusta]|eukprot:Sro1303_g260990.1 n/a (170) ;mRNA; f:14145-14805
MANRVKWAWTHISQGSRRGMLLRIRCDVAKQGKRLMSLRRPTEANDQLVAHEELTLTRMTLLLAVISRSNAFVSPVQNGVVAASSSSTSLFFFDMFMSDEEKQKKREKEERKMEEMEELQRQVLERRRNPEAMKEYEARVAVRRKLYMSGRDDAAKSFKVMTEMPAEDE